MALTFYPHEDDSTLGTLLERIHMLQDAAERFKAAVLEEKRGAENITQGDDDKDKLSTPHDFQHAFNWSLIARVLDEVRRLPESTDPDKSKKAEMLTQLATVYEILRGAKMPKLEAVRLALVNEAGQLKGGASAGV